MPRDYDFRRVTHVLEWAKQMSGVPCDVARSDVFHAMKLAHGIRVLELVEQYRDQFDPEDEYCRFHDLLAEANVGTGGET